LEKNKFIWSQSDKNEEIEKLIKECENKMQFLINKLKL
jgi:hypothetical protein